MAVKKQIVQVKNPKTGRYVKIDRSKGKLFLTKSHQVLIKELLLQKKETDDCLFANKRGSFNHSY